ncbi:hypothetical protein [Natronorubrum sp. DTA28]|uniref:hypothetical protein n=1 Tax=Natronorubrum sp. DTA28 TaxID=3447019 RepID=UPI003F869694
MARDTAESDGGKNGGKRAFSGDYADNNTLLDRRSYLKLAGATTAAATAAAGAASASGDDYDVITARGQTIRLGNETWENKLIDVTGGGSITVVVEGAATIRNVGVEGLYQGSSFIFSITNTGGTVTFENVYIGDGANKRGESFVHGPGAIFYHRSANCRVEFDRMNVQGYPNNGFYCSNTAHGGSVHWTNCYGKNNGVTTFRTGSGRDTLENCVAYNDNTDYSTSYGRWGNYSESHGRPLWHWGNQTMTATDCNFAAGSYGAAAITHQNGRIVLDGGNISGGTQGRVDTSRAGSTPDLSIPDGVPTSAEAAASGSSGGSIEPRGDYEDLRHTYEFVAEGEDEPTDYYFEIEDGPIEPSTYNGATVEDDLMWISDDGTRAAGRVVDGRHAWEFDTNIIDATVEGPAHAVVNDVDSNLDRYPLSGATGDGWKGDMPWHDEEEADEPEEDDGDDEDDHEFEHTYEFVAEGEDEPTDYYFEIEDGSPIVPSTYNGATIEDDFMWVSDDGTRAAGRVVDGRHAWEFDTLLVDVTVEGPAEPIVNDQQSHLSRYPLSGATGDEWKGDMPWHTSGEHTYEFVAEGESEPTDYYFEIEDGSTIVPSTYNGATIEDDYMWVSDDGTRAAGRVVDGRHAWEFDTLLVDVTVEGPAEPIVNDQQSHLSRYPLSGATGDGWKGDMPWHDGDLDRTLLIDGVGASGKTKYEFVVSGDVEPTTDQGSSINDDTEIDGGHVTGTINGWRDAFSFSGDLESITIDGSARVSLDGERIDPSEYGDELPHILTVVGNGSPAAYDVSVDGRIETIAWDASSRHATVDSDGTASGEIEDGYHRFRYAGSITDLSFEEGTAFVYANSDRIDPDDY